jgi:hypothetical protein
MEGRTIRTRSTSRGEQDGEQVIFEEMTKFSPFVRRP